MLVYGRARRERWFTSLATAALSAAADQKPAAVLPCLADSAATTHRVRPLLDRTGWLPRYIGGISHSAEIEIGGRYNEVTGHLGRTVLDEHEFTRPFGPETLPDIRAPPPERSRPNHEHIPCGQERRNPETNSIDWPASSSGNRTPGSRGADRRA
ncbi:hypothetical protein [Streptomyces sp. NBC_00358]|uniref:hypothetical protein n=1 Tax=Streptomyces sp. NBC_00358 TaxID=2975725 RepID=UPI002E254436